MYLSLNYLVVFYLTIPITATSSQQMLIFYGYPSDSSGCQVVPTINSWDECVQNCLSSISCVFATGNDNICGICSNSSTRSVEKGSEGDGRKVAFKTVSNDTLTTCSTNEDALMNPYQGSTDEYPVYNITFSSGKWNINYYKYLVEDGWEKFSRTKTDWGIKVICNSLFQPDAESECAARNAILTGLESQAEYDFVLNETIKDAEPKYQYYTWLGLEIKPECANNSNFQNTPSCNPKLFEWTDPYVTGDAGYLWGPKHPRAFILPNAIYTCHCAGLYALPTKNYLIDSECNQTAVKSGYKVRCYACGKPSQLTQV